jgi:hypothetical protein
LCNERVKTGVDVRGVDVVGWELVRRCLGVSCSREKAMEALLFPY